MLNILRLHITYTCTQEYNMPHYAGDVLRDALLSACACVSVGEVTLIDIIDKQVLLPSNPHVKLKRKGFSIDVHRITSNKFHRGDTIDFELLLFGTVATDYIHEVLQALHLLKWHKGSETNYFMLSAVVHLHPNLGKQQLFPNLRSPIVPIQFTDFLEDTPSSKRMNMHFLSPTVFDESGKYNGTYSMRTIVQKGLLRLLELSILYGDTPVTAYTEKIEVIAKLVKNTAPIVNSLQLEWQRYQFPSKRGTVTLSGMCGIVQWYGDFREIHPYLRLFSYLQIGKHTTYGFGVIDIEYV